MAAVAQGGVQPQHQHGGTIVGKRVVMQDAHGYQSRRTRKSVMFATLESLYPLRFGKTTQAALIALSNASMVDYAGQAFVEGQSLENGHIQAFDMEKTSFMVFTVMVSRF